MCANACDPNIHRTPPEADFEFVKCPAKSASWNNPGLQSVALRSNVTIPFAVGCVMNITDEACSSKIAWSVPLCN